MRTREDYIEAAEAALKQAETLTGAGTMSDREFLESMTRMDALLDHDVAVCGNCRQRQIMAQTARELLAEGEILDGIAKWCDAWQKRWDRTKFVRLWRKEQKAGRDPRKAFAERGWEP